MANSLIPYSFVPGTKALASEVNANFIALADSVEAGKQYTDTAIENFNTELETRLEEYDGIVSEKLQPDMSNSVNISNCKISQPNRIKYTLTNGTLTIKAGSVVIVPYGVADLREEYPAGSVFVNENYKVVDTGFTSNGFVVWVELQTDISAANTWTSKTKTTASLNLTGNYILSRGLHVDTFNYSASSNKIISGSSTDLISFPFMIATINSSGYLSVDQIFNGMGYLGSTVWLDKSVKLLVPDGLNNDGTYKNKEYTTTQLVLWTFENTSTWTRPKQALMLYIDTQPRILPNTANDLYFESYSEPDVNKGYVTWLNLSENKMYHSDSTAGVYTQITASLLGFVNIEQGKILCLTSRPVYKAADLSEVHRVITSLITSYNSVNKATNGYIKLGDGIILQWGYHANGTVTLPTAFSNSNYSVALSTIAPQGSHYGCTVTSKTTTSFQLVGNYSYTSNWIAIGY